ncbi:hypothetical protein BDN70DRAFT_872919 [Pholiota conissans]|uniref:Uncharacterized protein n=1 Tax=Pholiota conissans TaxID=109636 RepID=A0A9P5ZE18_9AGAR|nr:hypothetical protein BDN70DRAFT_872919 [Pholiota conissans]
MFEEVPVQPTKHPSSAIQNYLLQQRPNARMAITTDQDWIALIRDDDDICPSPEEFLERLKSSNIFRIVENKAGFVRLERVQTDSPTVDNSAAGGRNVSDQESSIHPGLTTSTSSNPETSDSVHANEKR